ncbi:MAG: OmpA family protein [bacterium]|nr:OmpA family protein [bacterium]
MEKHNLRLMQCLSLGILLLISFACTKLPARTELGEPKSELFYPAKSALDQAVSERADELAPDVYRQAVREYFKAEDKFEKGKSKTDVQKHLQEAEKLARKAIDTSQSMQSNFPQLIASRDKAIAAQAHKMDLPAYKKADKSFLDVCSDVEKGKIDHARKKADEATSNYRLAELQAIQHNMVGELNRQLKEIEKEDAHKLAPETYQTALKYRDQALEVLSQDRYNEELARQKVKEGEYYARKARFLAQKVKDFKGDKSNYEKLFLQREADLNRIASSLGVKPEFDKGFQVAVSEIDQAIQELKQQEQVYQRQLSSKDQALARAEQQIREAEQARARAEARIREAEEAKQRIASELKTTESALEMRRAAEEKMKAIQKMFSPQQAEVKLDPENNITIVLRSINFDSGRASLKPEHYEVLAKIKQTADLFPDRKMIISGHTDFTGSREFNRRLSLERAKSVMDYLRSAGVAPERMEAIGAGESKPIAPNTTAEGRKLNRRIEVTILAP